MNNLRFAPTCFQRVVIWVEKSLLRIGKTFSKTSKEEKVKLQRLRRSRANLNRRPPAQESSDYPPSYLRVDERRWKKIDQSISNLAAIQALQLRALAMHGEEAFFSLYSSVRTKSTARSFWERAELVTPSTTAILLHFGLAITRLKISFQF